MTVVTALPLMLGRAGVGELLRLPSEVRPGNWRILNLPPLDKFCDDEPLWYTANAVVWGVEHGHLPHSHGLSFPEPVPVWSQADIAQFFQVPLKTVRERWRWKYTRALRLGQSPPASALPPQDFSVEGVVLWLPATVQVWGVVSGKLNADGSLRERRGNRWIAPDVPVAAGYTDPKQQDIDAGLLMGFEQIAEYFGVQLKTVKAWHNGKQWQTGFQVGKDFPVPDGGTKDDGSPLWKRETIQAWGHVSRRTGVDKVAHPHGSGRRQRRNPCWYPVTVIGWAIVRGRLPADTPVPPGGMWARDDIAAYFGVSTETARQWIYQSQHGFPDPDGGDEIRRPARPPGSVSQESPSFTGERVQSTGQAQAA